jgi:hypothetical protein
MIVSVPVGLLALLQLGSVAASPAGYATAPVNETNCNGRKFVYEELAGWGTLPGDARDRFGDTIGGIGSAIALDKKSWKKKSGKNEAYQGILWGLPDRGWNTQGTQNTQSRLHKFSISFDIVAATKAKPAAPNFHIKYLDTLLLTGPDGLPTTGMNIVLLPCTSTTPSDVVYRARRGPHWTCVVSWLPRPSRCNL